MNNHQWRVDTIQRVHFKRSQQKSSGLRNPEVPRRAPYFFTPLPYMMQMPSNIFATASQVVGNESTFTAFHVNSFDALILSLFQLVLLGVQTFVLWWRVIYCASTDLNWDERYYSEQNVARASAFQISQSNNEHCEGIEEPCTLGIWRCTPLELLSKCTVATVNTRLAGISDFV